LSAPAILARGLRRDFGGVAVLAGVDLRVEPGEMLVLLRPSGGTLQLFGEDASRRPPATRRLVGHVGHESACYPDLSGRENLEFYAALYGVPNAGDRIAELLRWSGLEAAARRPVRVYSRGMTQRLALARALLHGPELLLLDEPFSGLDPAGAQRLQALLAELARAGHAIVLSTHDLERVAAVATRIAILHRGNIAWTRQGAADPVVLAASYEAVVTGRA